MPVAPSFDDLVAAGEAQLKSKRPELLVADGDVTEAMLHSAAAGADYAIAYAAQAFRDLFLDSAEGDALTALVDDQYNLQRHPATTSTGQVYFERTGGGAGGTIPIGTIVQTSQDASGEIVEFETTEAATVIAGSNGPWVVAVTATAPGRDGNVSAGAIDTIAEQPGFDNNFFVINPLATGGGNDAETDPELRSRARDYFASLARGTISALATGARQVPSVRYASVAVSESGIVTVRVSDVDGNSSTQMVNDVAAELVDWYAAGSIVNVVGGSRRVVDMTITIDKSRDGFILSNYTAGIQAAVADVMDSLNAAETLYLDQAIAATIGVAPRFIQDISITEILLDSVSQAIADVTAGDADVLRSGTITVVEA